MWCIVLFFELVSNMNNESDTALKTSAAVHKSFSYISLLVYLWNVISLFSRAPTMTSERKMAFHFLEDWICQQRLKNFVIFSIGFSENNYSSMVAIYNFVLTQNKMTHSSNTYSCQYKYSIYNRFSINRSQ